MKFIFLYLSVLLIFSIVFVNIEFSPVLWAELLLIVFLLFLYAMHYRQPRYQYLVAYDFNGGKGRIFLDCEQKHINENLITSFEDFISEKHNVDNVGIFNIQKIGKL